MFQLTFKISECNNFWRQRLYTHDVHTKEIRLCTKQNAKENPGKDIG